MDQDIILDVRDLGVTFVEGHREIVAVSNATFELRRGRKVGIIGESGSGKSVTALSLLRLHDEKRIRYGPDSMVEFRGENVFDMSRRRLNRFRGGQVGMVFQDPMTSLNPTFTIGSQIEDVIRLHHRSSRAEAKNKAVAALAEVELPNPRKLLGRYPNELSGGQRQRALIAMVLACDPYVLIADEPTSGLDVTVQAGILEMLIKRSEERDIGVLMITHDMGVVARFCDDLYVMYGGRVVESGSVGAVFNQPAHPYTAGLMRAIPQLTGERGRLYSIKGRQQTRDEGAPHECVFADRCDFARPECRSVVPALEPVAGAENTHYTACLRHEEIDLTLVGAGETGDEVWP